MSDAIQPKEAPVLPEKNQGEFTVEELREGDQEDYRRVIFHKPMKVDWYVEEPKKEEDAPTDGSIVISTCLDDGIILRNKFSPTNPHPAGKLIGLSTIQIEETIRNMLAYDFAHSFFHYNGDPNYGIDHWAIYGNYKDLVRAEERIEGHIEYVAEYEADEEGSTALNYAGIHPKSIIGRRMTARNLDLLTTSVFHLCCVENNLDPTTSSMLDLAAAKMGKNPKETSLKDAENYYGTNWVSSVCN